MTEPLIQPPEPDPRREETLAFWREVGRSLIKESLPALDDTAKQFVTVSGILVGLYYNAIAFSKIPEKPDHAQHLVAYAAPIGLLLLSLVFALLVFFPNCAKLNLWSAEGAHHVYERTVAGKLCWLRLSGLFLAAGIVAIWYSLLLYLRG